MDIKYIPTNTEISALVEELPWADVKRSVALFMVVQFNTTGNDSEQVLNNTKTKLLDLIKQLNYGN